MNGLIGNPCEFSPDIDDWTIYQERLEQYFTANKIKEDDIQVATLISLIGTPTYRILRDLCHPIKPKEKKYKELCELLKKQYSPHISEWRERAKFYELTQQPAETISEWYARIRNASVNCSFEDQLSKILKDKFVTGLRKGPLFDRLCEEDVAMELEKLVSVAQKKEATLQHVQEVNKITGNNKLQPRNSYHPRPDFKQSYQSNSKPNCKHCGKNHRGECKYANFTCNVCKIKGHLGAICSQKKSRTNHFLEVESGLYCMMNNAKEISNPFTVIVNIDQRDHLMEIDSGAGVSCISLETYENFFSKYPLVNNTITLKSYTGHPIRPKGCVELDVIYKGKEKRIKFCVIEKGGPSLLGRDWLESFKVGFQAVNKITESLSVEKVIDQFPQVFSGKLGCYKYAKISLELKQDAKPIFCKPRTVPLAFREPMDRELDRLIKDGVLSPIESSAWGTPLVPILKTDGTLRLCGDYKSTVNKYLVDVTYPLPRVEEIFAKLHKGEYFSKIDLNQAYTQFELEDEAKKLLTWSTHRGLFTMNRMPFGISPASAKFQKYLEQLFIGMDNVVNFLDDILITGANRDEHLKTLEAVLRRLDQAGLTVKKEKCKFFQEEVEYMGHVISKKGLRKTDDKVLAIIHAPEPTTITQVRSFCGLVNYYSKFVPNLAQILKPIYNLLSKTEEFKWSRECQQSFEEIKNVLASDACLVHFNPSLPIVLTTDASAEGISAVLSHVVNGEEKMVGCVSRTLMPAEKNYPVVHREALAIYYGVTKFHQYLYGHKWTLKTDHKPLLALFGEHKGIPSMYASRLQRWAAYLSSFNYTIQYIKGKNNPVADCLSRVPRKVTTISPEYNHHGKYINFATTSEEWPINAETIQKATKKDATLSRVIKCLQKNDWSTASADLKPYQDRKEELSHDQGILSWGYRIAVPQSLRKRLLQELHSAHFGIVRMKSQARSWMWWPGLDKDIENICKSCLPCLQSRQDLPKTADTSWHINQLISRTTTTIINGNRAKKKTTSKPILSNKICYRSSPTLHTEPNVDTNTCQSVSKSCEAAGDAVTDSENVTPSSEIYDVHQSTEEESSAGNDSEEFETTSDRESEPDANSSKSDLDPEVTVKSNVRLRPKRITKTPSYLQDYDLSPEN